MSGNGEVVNRYQYDTFGNTVEAVEKVQNRFRHAGEQYDQVTGQYYLRARFYNPVVGRSTQEGTYRGDGLNLYSYVNNNPNKYYDPSGYCAEKSNPYRDNLSVFDARGYDKFLVKKKHVPSEVDARKAFQQLLDRDFEAYAKNFDFLSKPNKAHFWSGDKEIAREVAKRNKGTIMEDTPGGKVIDGCDWLNEKYPATPNWRTGNNLGPQPLWKVVSKEYTGIPILK
ncbi:MAG TPA: RHS repeat-associated core domain-containing protein [Pseudobacteroides sp.]|uniref:RHS repeat-associated core domain-containing protein n=1 Tax=Pseudobacteroides sp. TaxID=1968840 RepID=UPI002F951A20